MPALSIHHIGYLVKKIEKARQAFLSLGYEAEQDIVYDHIRKVNICFLVKDGYRIELVPYHICYETADFEAAYAELAAGGFIAIDTPTPAPALGGRDVVFLSSASIGMIELIR